MPSLWPQSGTIARDNSDVRAVGALAYFYSGGTTTPISIYADSGQATPLSNPVTSDANGRWPTVFVPFMTSYDYKVTTAGGTQLAYPTEIPNVDPTDVAATITGTTIETGHIHAELINTTKTGYVRLNGRTMGNGSSGGTERANADTEDLFTYLWNNVADGQAAVSGGRGASAAADYAANKTITLPDWRGRLPLGLDDMGNAAASRLTSAPVVSGSATAAGSVLGENTHVLTSGELAAHTHGPGSYTADSQGSHTHTATTSSDGAHTHGPGATAFVDTQAGAGIYQAGGTGSTQAATASNGGHTHTLTTSSDGAHTHTVTGGVSGSTGSGTAHNVLSSSVLVTWYIKL